MSSGVGLRILARYPLGQSRHQSRSSPAAKRAARHRWSARPSALTFELIEPLWHPSRTNSHTTLRLRLNFAERRFVRTNLRSLLGLFGGLP